MSNQQHTKEPWWNHGVIIKANDNIPAQATSEEDARRIVACVNACAGIPTEALESEGSAAPARCIKPDCKTDCDQCSCAIPSSDYLAMLVADLLEEVRDGHGGPYEDGEHPTVDRARAFLMSRSTIASAKETK